MKSLRWFLRVMALGVGLGVVIYVGWILFGMLP